MKKDVLNKFSGQWKLKYHFVLDILLQYPHHIDFCHFIGEFTSHRSIEKSFEALIRSYNGRRSGLRVYFRGLSSKHANNTRLERPIAKFVQTKDFPDTKDTRHFFVCRNDRRIFYPITTPLDATEATNAPRKKRNEEIILLATHNSYMNWQDMNQFCK